MRILVTGATGFAGRALVARLTAASHTVVAVSRNPERARKKLRINEAYSWDRLPLAFEEPIEAVVHLAGESVKGRWTKKKTEEVWNSRISTTKLLMSAVSDASPRPAVVVSASGIGFYGDGGEEVLDEDSGAGDDYFAKLCVEWEGLVLGAPLGEVRCVCARFGIILGSDGGALESMLLPAKTGLSGPLGSGRQWWSWVSRRDAVSALIHIIETADVSGPVNVVSPFPTRQADFQKVLGKVLKRPAVFPAPAFGVRLLLGTFATEVLSSKKVLPTVLERAGFQWEDSDLNACLTGVLRPGSSSVLLPLLAAFALLGAPYGQEPHFIQEVGAMVSGQFEFTTIAHASFHAMFVPWLLISLVWRLS